MRTRRHLLAELESAAADRRWDDCRVAGFELLYGRPPDLQLRAAEFMLGRARDVVRRDQAVAAWVDELLRDVPAWVARRGRAVADSPDGGPAEAAFLSALDGLLLGWAHRDDAATLTSSVVYAISAVVNARQTAVWEAHDSEAVELWRRGEDVTGRSALDLEPAQAAAEREWRALIEWLRAEDGARDDPVSDDPDRDRALARWRAAEMSLLPPPDS